MYILIAKFLPETVITIALDCVVVHIGGRVRKKRRGET
jgi:hypothetical protein